MRIQRFARRCQCEIVLHHATPSARHPKASGDWRTLRRSAPAGAVAVVPAFWSAAARRRFGLDSRALSGANTGGDLN